MKIFYLQYKMRLSQTLEVFMFSQIPQLIIQFFFLLTPFFALTVFLSLSEGLTHKEIFKFVLRTTIAILIICYILVFAGPAIFKLFGITVDAFRIGAGIILFLNGLDLVRGHPVAAKSTTEEDVAVVPLAIPIIVGPAVIGTLLVMASESTTFKTKLPLLIALTIAVLMVSALLLAAPGFIRVIGKKGVIILSRLTGLILAALAAQIIFTGIQAFLVPGMIA